MLNGDGFLTVLAHSIAKTQVPLDLTQACKRSRQIDLNASLATEVESFDPVSLGIVEPMLSSRLVGLCLKFVGCIRHAAVGYHGRNRVRRVGRPQC